MLYLFLFPLRAFQEPVISGSCQQALLDICNSVWVSWHFMGWIPRLGRPWIAFPSVSAPHFVSHEYFVPPSGKEWCIHTLFFLLLEHHLICDCILDIQSYWPNIQLSVSKYYVCTFMTGLPHSGWYFIVPSICLWISWSHCF